MPGRVWPASTGLRRSGPGEHCDSAHVYLAGQDGIGGEILDQQAAHRTRAAVLRPAAWRPGMTAGRAAGGFTRRDCRRCCDGSCVCSPGPVPGHSVSRRLRHPRHFRRPACYRPGPLHQPRRRRAGGDPRHRRNAWAGTAGAVPVRRRPRRLLHEHVRRLVPEQQLLPHYRGRPAAGPPAMASPGRS